MVVDGTENSERISEPRLTTIVPTIGRATLADTLESIRQQRLLPGDEVIVVADGHHPDARAIAEEYSQGFLPVRYLTHGPTRDFGNSQRNFAQRIAHGTHVLFMDDDDAYTEEAFTKIRKAILKNPNRALMFRMISVWGEVIWRERKIERGNTITPMFVVPNAREALPLWPRRQGGDVTFMEAYRGQIVWREEIIAIGRPEKKWWAI